MRRILLVLFFASGAAGLVYEVIWVRLFGLVMGNTVFSITTVLAAFMGGLALGSALGGRAAARAARPVRVYALLEAGVGLYCLAVPLLVSALEPACRYLYRNLYDRFLLFHLCLFLLGALVLVPGTALMGATLPFLARAVAGDERRLGTRLGDLYSANTAGAVVGVLAAGFFLIPGLGLSWTNRLGAAANLAVAAVAWALAKRLDAGTIRAEARGAAPADLTASPPVSRLATITLLAAFGASGATSLSYQIAWARSFTMAIGASTYSFTVIVAAFILGIALGSAIFGRLADWTGKPHALLAGCLAVAGVAGPLSPLVLERVPLWLVGLVFSEAGEGSFARLQAIQFSLLFAILLVPTTALGGAFPLVARALAPAGGDGRGVASVVGRAYAVNTLAAILGSMATGFLLVPAQSIGIQGSLRIAGGLAIVAAAAVAFGAPLAARLAGPRARLARRALFATGALAPGALVLLWSPAWDVEVMGAGIYLYGPVYARKAQESKKSIREVIHERGDVVFHREGVSATVQVKEFEDERTGRPALVLLVNGKPEATTSGDMRTQTLLGHLATVFHPAPESGLVIGLGGGLTLASMATHDLSAIDCVEISDAVVEAAQRDFSGLSFARANGRVLEQAGVRLILGDGRTHVFFGEDRYDVLSSEPSNPWIAGVANLFTIEFFRQARERLAAGGLICQWVQAYRMSVDDFRMIVRTFRSVFPEACLFKAQSFENAVSGDFFLVAGRDGFDPPMSAVVRALKLTRVARDLAAVEIETPLDLVDGHVLGPAELDAFAGEGPVNTDDNALLEFSSPRSFYSPGTVPLLGALLTYRRGPPPWWTSDGTIPEPAAVARYRAMTAYYASIVAWGDSDYDTAVLRAEEALAADPTKKGGKDYVVRLLGERADARIAANRVDDAIADYLCMLQHDPGRAEAWLNLGDLYLRKGMASRAEAAFKNATLLPSAEPRYVALAHANLARLYLGRRDLPGARREFASALALDPENADILYDLARLEFDEDRLPAALEYAARAARTGSRRTDVHNLHGDLLRLSGRPREALSAYRASLAIDGDQGEVELRLSELHYQLGEFDEAYDSLERATSLGADVNPAFRANVRRAAGK